MFLIDGWVLAVDTVPGTSLKSHDRTRRQRVSFVPSQNTGDWRTCGSRSALDGSQVGHIGSHWVTGVQRLL